MLVWFSAIFKALILQLISVSIVEVFLFEERSTFFRAIGVSIDTASQISVHSIFLCKAVSLSATSPIIVSLRRWIPPHTSFSLILTVPVSHHMLPKVNSSNFWLDFFVEPHIHFIDCFLGMIIRWKEKRWKWLLFKEFYGFEVWM